MMSATTETHTFTVALIGNPNTGKSTLFSALVGVHQHVGNYPGVTVEKKTGQMSLGGRPIDVIDLPGLYSLAPRSRDEMVVVDLLLGRRSDVRPVDAVLCIVDAGNLERNLYLVSQVLELGLPTVLAVNMLDVAENRGIRIDLARLERRLGIPSCAIQANRRTGLPQLKAVLARNDRAACGAGVSPAETVQPGRPQHNQRRCPSRSRPKSRGWRWNWRQMPETSPTGPLPRCLVRRLLLDVSGYFAADACSPTPTDIGQPQIEAARARLAAAGCPVPAVETAARYAWARRMFEGVVDRARPLPDHRHRPHRSRADASRLGHDGFRRGDAGRSSSRSSSGRGRPWS